MIRTIKKLFLYFVMSSFTFVGFTQSVQAALIGTEQAVAAAPLPDRAKLAAQLSRPEVQAQFEKLGISKSDAEQRVAALTDEEASLLAERIDALPAGGDVVGAILLVFLVLLLTDILGFTKIFPFTRSVR